MYITQIKFFASNIFSFYFNDSSSLVIFQSCLVQQFSRLSKDLLKSFKKFLFGLYLFCFCCCCFFHIISIPVSVPEQNKESVHLKVKILSNVTD